MTVLRKIILSLEQATILYLETINIMKHSKENGFNLFLLMPPAYYKYGDEGAYIYYSKIIDKVSRL